MMLLRHIMLNIVAKPPCMNLQPHLYHGKSMYTTPCALSPKSCIEFFGFISQKNILRVHDSAHTTYGRLCYNHLAPGGESLFFSRIKTSKPALLALHAGF